MLNSYDYMIGIDPGLTGAIAVLESNGRLVAIHDLPIGGNGKGKAKVKNQISAPELANILQKQRLNKAGVQMIGCTNRTH